MKKLVVAFFGPRGVGKNYLSEILTRSVSLETSVKLTAFADPIKVLVQKIFGFSPYYLWGPSSSRDVFPIDWERNIREAWEGALDVIRWSDKLLTKEERSLLLKVYDKMYDECVEVQPVPGPPYVLHKPKTPFTPRYALREISEAFKEEFGQDYWVAKTLAPTDYGVTVISDGRFPLEAAAVKANKGILIRVFNPKGEILDDHPTEKCLLDIPDGSYDFKIANDGEKFDKVAYKRLLDEVILKVQT